MERYYYVYILASRRNGTLYVGVTNDLARRVWQHREGTGSLFTKKYGVTKLVWYEHFHQIVDAIACEKKLKRWRRAWKLAKIESFNPDWRDLYETWNQ
jgi:putative endonuclease